ncbi:MAG: HAD family hydrolase [Actinomycetota bacterium]
MALSAVVFDVGETLVDETRHARTGDPDRPFATADLHADALPCIAELRRRGLRVGAAGNMHAIHETFLFEHVDAVGSSERWGVRKPAPAFFEHVVQLVGAAPDEVAYVGDRVDNDIVPALAAGLVAVHVRRGSWAHLQPTPDGVAAIDSLDELPDVLA